MNSVTKSMVVIDQLKKIGCSTAKNVLAMDVKG
jgi:hypothetical protein